MAGAEGSTAALSLTGLGEAAAQVGWDATFGVFKFQGLVFRVYRV